MCKLRACAEAYESLCDVQYKITLGHKGTKYDICLGFQISDFYHLAGLHKLNDISFIRSNSSTRVFAAIKKGVISYEDIQKSSKFSSIEGRLDPLAVLENLIDNNQVIFKFVDKTYSQIVAEYILVLDFAGQEVYFFIDKNKDGEYFGRSFFPYDKQDYKVGQTSYAMLYKAKVHLSTGTTQVQYDKLTPPSAMANTPPIP